MSEPPRPRYRIFERDRRLIVIDNWAPDKTPAQPAPQPARPQAAPPQPTLGPRSGAPNRIVRAGDEGGALLRRLALAACLGAESPEGRPILTTASWFDAKAPRTFLLGPTGIRRLGGAALAVMVAFMLVLALAASTDFLFVAMFLLIGGFATFAKHGRPIATRWIDGFERLSD